MDFPFFTPKTLGSVLAGAGSMGGGGGAVYLYQMPRTWKDLLIKEGFVFLNTNEEYKGMFYDQKNEDNGTNENDLKDATDNDVKSKTETYCHKKFNETLPSSSDLNYSATKQKLISFCTTEGIKTVKGRLIQSKQQNWIGENEEEKGKVVFAVYRYNDEFIEWLKKDNPSNSNLSKNSNVKDEYSKLKDACKKLLAKNHADVKNEKEFNYGSGGCVELGYTTIEDKIKTVDKNWSVKQQSDSDWETLKTKWENTPEVKKGADKANGGNNEESPLSEATLKKLCENTNVTSKLSDNDSYQEKYLVIKNVCQNTSGQQQ